ncbi:hypothetical protein AS156_07155 [Bradyrhizobium macuxiense]|uniref:Uncharacterized protein n=1 Tax=Bradyrhizobium macuxiense TaxID=1755647 RepID=A0A109JT93_9BRAD|nr:hypothetical protein [Bradyrhizobium macuxiense]KWV54732.1 hypothetical protein AS156_07155 [Bradyrhizobium macuxiense]
MLAVSTFAAAKNVPVEQHRSVTAISLLPEMVGGLGCVFGYSLPIRARTYFQLKQPERTYPVPDL